MSNTTRMTELLKRFSNKLSDLERLYIEALAALPSDKNLSKNLEREYIISCQTVQKTIALITNSLEYETYADNAKSNLIIRRAEVILENVDNFVERANMSAIAHANSPNEVINNESLQGMNRKCTDSLINHDINDALSIIYHLMKAWDSAGNLGAGDHPPMHPGVAYYDHVKKCITYIVYKGKQLMHFRLRYMSFDLVSGSKMYDRKTEAVYTWALTIIFILTGKHPYHGMTNVFEAMCKKTPVVTEDVTKDVTDMLNNTELSDLIFECLGEPTKRPSIDKLFGAFKCFESDTLSFNIYWKYD